jgi:hypothetical protein
VYYITIVSGSGHSSSLQQVTPLNIRWYYAGWH